MVAMTPTDVRRPLPRRPAPPVRRTAPSPLGPGLVAAGWALGVGWVVVAIPVLLAWATDSRSGSGAAAATRTAGQLWLVAHGTSLSVPGGVLGLTPIGLLLLPLLLLHRAGRHSARTLAGSDLRQAAVLVLAICLPYAVAAALVATAAAGGGVQPAPVQALLGALLVALVGAGSGVLREVGPVDVGRWLPSRVRRLAVGTATAVGGLLCAGAAVAGISFAVHADRAHALASASDPGVVGGLALLLLGATLVPNAAIWGTAWLAGPGFAVGVGTAVGPFGTSLGPVPALPMLAALPGSAPPAWVGVLGLGVALLAGALAGLLVARRLTTDSTWIAAAEAALVGPSAGAVFALLAALSGGALGGGRLATVGPTPWKVGLAVTVEVGLAAALTAAVAVRRCR